MTEAEKLRNELALVLGAYGKLAGNCFPDFDAVDRVLKLLGIPLEFLPWCRTNPELVEALAKGAWQAVPVVADRNMVAAINTHHDGDSNSGDAVWERALEAAPKKPEE